ncbi:MAG: hypothetical protein R3F11_12060 [Verrucomicrobiales bacterium]
MGEYTLPLSAAGVAELQAMRDGAMENFGYLFRSMAEQTAFTGRRWATREHRTDPPALAVTYEPPPRSCPARGSMPRPAKSSSPTRRRWGSPTSCKAGRNWERRLGDRCGIAARRRH